jgi:hypothetical protein
VSVLWIVQASAEGGGRLFNVLVSDDDRDRAESVAVEALLSVGWGDVAPLRSAQVSETGLASRDQTFQNSAVAARELGWSIIGYQRDS